MDDKNFSILLVNGMPADDLATQGARASAAMVFN